jgi:hypothetical protein
MTKPETAEASPPDWDRIDEDVVCPLCEYNLRGLAEARCPECGYRFEWPEIMDPTRRLHLYLFEHHPERNFWSFRKTVVGSCLPRRFWKRLHPSQPSRPRRLILYACLVLGIFYLAFACQLAVLTVHRAQQLIATGAPQRAGQAQYLKTPWGAKAALEARDEFGSVDNYLDARFPTRITTTLLRGIWDKDRIMWAWRTGVLLLMVWPWATLAGLMVFRVSMRRARIKAIHVLRCVVYSSDLLAWVGVALLVIVIVLASIGRSVALGTPTELVTIAWSALPVVLVICPYRRVVAYQRYLRFDHPVSTVLASQAIALLVLANIIAVSVL